MMGQAGGFEQRASVLECGGFSTALDTALMERKDSLRPMTIVPFQDIQNSVEPEHSRKRIIKPETVPRIAGELLNLMGCIVFCRD